MKFSLDQGEWYAMEVLSDFFDFLGVDPRYCSPIRVEHSIERPSGDKPTLSLAFLELFYPRGVQTKRYQLRVLEWGTHYLLAESTEHDPKRILLVLPLTEEWLTQRCQVDLEEGVSAEQWAQEYLISPSW